ncbi:MAG: Mannose-6-phosphate isomerase [Actinomycetia bacterium]|nr:Mannose-6-phosphate isomerase [Actinomycetes bacterium]
MISTPADLDDAASIAEGDPGEMLRQVASSAAQIRQAQLLAAEAGIGGLAADGRPRAVVVAGMGGSAIAGDVLVAVCGLSSPVPVVTVRGYQLPGWVGAADLVFAVSCSGRTEETLALAAEAVRRGCRLVCVGAADSPLKQIAVQGRAPYVPVQSAGQPRATLWGLTVPLLMAVRAVGLLDVPETLLEATAARLEDISHRCRPSSETFVNPGKQLAADLAGSVPMVWGTSPLAGVAAYRFACQLNENAKYPAVHGELPEADHNQVMAFDGPFGGSAAGDPDDFFRDRTEESATGVHLVVLRDTEEHPQVTKRREASSDLARERGVPVTELMAEGTHPLERIASLIALTDYASVYLALTSGIDPTPVTAIQELKARIA